KRNGVTFRRLRGDSDVEIQHAARWTSTKQLKVYDMSNHEDAFKMELVKRGIINSNDPNSNNVKPKLKTCMFCKKVNGLTNETCENCHRLLDRDKLRVLEKNKENSIIELKNELQSLKENSNVKNVEVLNNIMGTKEVSDLFKLVYKLQKEVSQLKNG
ncbi:MAG: hypothetical protein AABW52_02370, partial [Nanoarchaeota archaeon]